MQILIGLLIPFIGTILGAATVFLLKDKLSKSGFKGHFTEDEILKRNELSEIFGIDFDDIVKLFDKVRDINKKMVIDDMCGYSDIRSLMSENPYVINDVINQAQKYF